MYRKIILLFLLLCLGTQYISADRGNALTVGIKYQVICSDADMQLLADELFGYLEPSYKTKTEFSKKYIWKSDWKKFAVYQSKINLWQADMYVRISVDIRKRVPSFFYKDHDDSCFFHLAFTNYGWFDDKIDEYFVFCEEVKEKIKLYAQNHGWQIVYSNW